MNEYCYYCIFCIPHRYCSGFLFLLPFEIKQLIIFWTKGLKFNHPQRSDCMCSRAGQAEPKTQSRSVLVNVCSSHILATFCLFSKLAIVPLRSLIQLLIYIIQRRAAYEFLVCFSKSLYFKRSISRMVVYVMPSTRASVLQYLFIQFYFLWILSWREEQYSIIRATHHRSHPNDNFIIIQILFVLFSFPCFVEDQEKYEIRPHINIG